MLYTPFRILKGSHQKELQWRLQRHALKNPKSYALSPAILDWQSPRRMAASDSSRKTPSSKKRSQRWLLLGGCINASPVRLRVSYKCWLNLSRHPHKSFGEGLNKCCLGFRVLGLRTGFDKQPQALRPYRLPLHPKVLSDRPNSWNPKALKF